MAHHHPTRCTATSKRRGDRCAQYAMHGTTVCYHHGGKTPRGLLSPHFRHGRHSQFLPTGLRQRYEQALGDPDLLTLRNELALCDTRLSALLEHLDVEGTVAAWGKVRQTLAAFQHARQDGEHAAMQTHFDALVTLITAGAADLEVWQEVYVVLDLRRRLSETEQKRLVVGQQMITAERAQVLIVAIMATIKEQVALHVAPDTARPLLSGLSVAFSKLAVLEGASSHGQHRPHALEAADEG